MQRLNLRWSEGLLHQRLTGSLQRWLGVRVLKWQCLPLCFHCRWHDREIIPLWFAANAEINGSLVRDIFMEVFERRFAIH